jgi:hypothetical protein
MFGLYALPPDDLAGTATSVTASDEDPEYVATNLIAPTNTGHLNLPSRPAKLTTTQGYWDLVFPGPITVQAVVLVYHDLAPDIDVTLEPSGGTPIPITIPSRWENGWSPSAFEQFEAQTASTWRLAINEDNDLLPQIGRILLYGSGGFRQLARDVRWGVEEIEEQGQIEHATYGAVETLYELWGPRRAFVGEFALDNTQSTSLITLYRSARNRILPWLLIPDEDVNDAWFVRFTEPRWSRTRETIDHNIFPFRVQELSRGLPWP